MWSAIFMVGAAGRRRIWTRLVPAIRTYPNLFVFLVGPPGVGKTQAIVPAGEHLRKSDTARMAPNDVTKQSLLDRLAKASDAVTFEGPPPVIEEFHYMTLIIRELSNFMSQYDHQLAGILTDLFDNPPVNEESKRGRDDGKSIAIIKPGLSIIAGTATKNLGKTISGDLWGQGFMSRVIMVYSADQPPVDFFGSDEAERAHVDPTLVYHLSEIGSMKGEMGWDKPAQRAWKDWYNTGMKPVPQHSKLVEYNARRFLHVAKLAMISAMSNLRMTITEEDFHRGRLWLERAEKAMPEIFKEMAIHSDGEILRELHMHAWAIHARSKQPLEYSTLSAFLLTKVASRDIPRLIEVAESSGMFDRLAGTQGFTARFVPKAHYGDIPE